MAKRRRAPYWLYAVLSLLLVVLALLAWLSAEDGSPQDKQTKAGSKLANESWPADQTIPEIPHYEDFQQLSRQANLGWDVPSYPPTVNPPRARGIALIMDDIGYDMHALQRVLALPFKVAISVLPGAPGAKKAAEMAHAAGHIVMLHLPMEPANPVYQQRMDDSFLRIDMNEAQVRALFLQALDRVPHAVGVNNHMGSLLTSSAAHMQWVMSLCREQGLFFVDSRTSRDSVAAEQALQFGLTWGERKVFFDHQSDPESLQLSWQAAQRCLKRHKSCIVIAHPYAQTLDFLEHRISEQDQQWIQPVTDILHSNSASLENSS
ncbi:MAG: divergent polysaccharide deacetylase family protein [Mariprofundaceae bacterium]